MLLLIWIAYLAFVALLDFLLVVFLISIVCVGTLIDEWIKKRKQ